MPLELSISHLAAHAEAHPLVAGWLRSAWPSWYGPGGHGDAETDVRRYSQLDALPLGLLAFHQGAPCAFGVLKQDTVPGFEQAQAWLGAGYVVPPLRGQGLGLRLIHALEAEAGRLGFAEVFCATATARSLMERAAWSRVGESLLGAQQVAVYRRVLARTA